MDPAMIPWAVGAVLTLCGIAITATTLRRGPVTEADKRYIAALEQMRKDDQETQKKVVSAIEKLTEAIGVFRDDQKAMHQDNRTEHNEDMNALRKDHADIVRQHHEDMMETRNALRGAEGAIAAAVNAVDRWRHQ